MKRTQERGLLHADLQRIHATHEQRREAYHKLTEFGYEAARAYVQALEAMRR